MSSGVIENSYRVMTMPDAWHWVMECGVSAYDEKKLLDTLVEVKSRVIEKDGLNRKTGKARERLYRIRLP